MFVIMYLFWNFLQANDKMEYNIRRNRRRSSSYVRNSFTNHLYWFVTAPKLQGIAIFAKSQSDSAIHYMLREDIKSWAHLCETERRRWPKIANVSDDDSRTKA
ncbi:hypothetical protein M9H77_28670 [Catharanthus roseus]|uniref:Uncharacterized protein n=1 Tax=Catharanthus roseus TaxID=4058 RepID=A0ACC0AG00_CATRO|nr:hypothetical protein M9H77_28670 [Catharanthus roseus]